MEKLKSCLNIFNQQDGDSNEIIITNKMPIENKNEYCDYDAIIDIDSINNLNGKGWNIIYSGDEEKQRQMIESDYKVIISVLGNSNRGKTHILQKLCGKNIKSGYQVQTKGLSMKFYEHFIYLDTAGTNTPFLIEDEKKRPSESEIQRIYLCQIITNYIIQTFVIDHADIILCVIGMLNSGEQIFLEKIKKLCENKKNLIVIHNLVKCENNEDIIKYKNETLLKMIPIQLVEKKMPNFGKNIQKVYDKYFIEKENKHVKHFIYVSDEKKSKEMQFYNRMTLDYIKTCIKMEKTKQKNLFSELIQHVEKISSYVLEKEIKLKKIENSIKCQDKEINPKDIKADDNIIFIGKEYEPPYRYYRRGQFFIFEIQICSKSYNLKESHILDTDSNETNFTISGERIPNTDDEKNYLINKRKNFTKFKIVTKVKLLDFDIKHINKEPRKQMKFGIVYLIYKII